jgi:hypothetical protein
MFGICLIGLESEDGGVMFVRNIDEFLPDYMEVQITAVF